MIQRDGHCKSLWQTDALSYRPVNRLNRQRSYDVVIVGGGITGVSTALLLQQAGKSCLLLEANTLCFGTTGGTTAHLNTVMDTPYATITSRFGKESALLVRKAAEQAIGLIRRNIRKYDIHCSLESADAILFSKNEAEQKQLEDIYSGSRDCGVSLTYTDWIPIDIPFTMAIRVKKQAKFNPVKYVYALARAFEEAGGTIVQRCRVTGAGQKNPVEISTGQGTIQAEYLVYATHIPPGVSLLNLRCAPYRSYAMALKLSDNKYFGELVYDMEDPYHYYRTQWVKGKKYLIAGGEDHKTGHVEDTEECFLKLEANVRKWFAVKEITHRWSSQYFEPADGLPYIGELPGKNGKILVATGFGGNGMIYSSIAAMLLRKLIRKEKSPLIDLFRPGRIKPAAGFSNFVKENADVVLQYAQKWIPSEKIEKLSDLKTGEGRSVQYGDLQLALFKDQQGNVHAVDSTCTHLQCRVSWNRAEKSWDCPCHGARYSPTGKMLTGPADKDLESISLTTAKPQTMPE